MSTGGKSECSPARERKGSFKGKKKGRVSNFTSITVGGGDG